MKKIAEKLLETVNKYAMIRRGDRVLACVSGGADSVALLRLLLELKEELGLGGLFACHFNHGLRGESSDADERFTLELCASLGVECFSEKAEMRKLERPSGMSEESFARSLRYAFFERCAAEKNALIATAHNRGDMAETVLFNLARGAGLEGAGGIPPLRGNIIRPLIDISRTEIEGYLLEAGAPYVTDESNLSETYARNRVRHGAMSALMSVNSAAERNIALFAERARQTDAYLSKKASEALRGALISASLEELPIILSAPALISEDELIQSLALKALLERLRPDVGTEIIAPALRVLEGELREVEIIRGVYLRREGEKLEILRRDGQTKARGELYVPLTEGENVFCEGRAVVLRRLSQAEFKNFNSFDLNNAADCAKIYGNIVARSRRAGDRFSSRLRNCTKSLKKLFNERGIEPEKRDLIPVVCDDRGIVWLGGEGVSRERAATEETREIIVFEMKELD
ncbi:MAG: tRNA lysidine(34) synthetase TilS [Oscillospiraceae bacterium]|nr:tRNA lysidine(34) synthetase TilS [Oscillospiraceae bacterium]